jgi:hypothetical protein
VYVKLEPTASHVVVVGHATPVSPAIFDGNLAPPVHFSPPSVVRIATAPPLVESTSPTASQTEADGHASPVRISFAASGDPTFTHIFPPSVVRRMALDSPRYMVPRQNDAVRQAKPLNGARPRLGGKVVAATHVVPPFVVDRTLEAVPSPASHTAIEEQATTSMA